MDREAALRAAEAEKDALTARLAEVERERESDFAQALEQEVRHRSALREERRRTADLETELAALTSRAAAQASEGEALRAEFLEREATHRSTLKEERQRAAELERELAALTSRGAAQAMEWAASRAEFLEGIARFTAQAASAQAAQSALQAEKAAAERSIALLETEAEALSERLAQVERDRDEAMADAARHDLTSRLQKKKWTAADKNRQGALNDADTWFKAQAASLTRAEERAAGLQKELAANAEGLAKQGREWQNEKMDMSKRLERVEAARAAAEDSHRDAVSRNKEAEHALATMQAQRDDLALKLTEAENAHIDLLARMTQVEQSLESDPDR